ncbi:phosphate signaling complex protein PhoU [Pseudohoeflea coraliihabitans]|uniref:Phosphate-specific transport system accessory protein PhoU n=1 Tax=Pseudohoeflea coraliihabitans TaxID=2860393 RepID=A0ABS6WNF6_9HYPH|nr:phosphate signaling complex protein PhoU [Pseudohoeflea sp. DP4N28-3]MBW3097494.1 phosphate signaling complex protein PhoU [Pseudohoeflea sp. DP4N28-3]
MPATHTVTAYDDELRWLMRRISEMGGLAEGMVADSLKALIEADTALAQRVISEDVLLDRAEREISEKAVLVIAKRQPMASDLREIIGSIRIAADLERVGDLGKNIAKRVIAVHTMAQPKSLVRGLEHLSELALTQLKEVLDAFSSKSSDLAVSIRERDDEIDAIYTSLFRELLTYMMEDPRNITACTHLLFCAKNIERIGDHATNIAETVFYVATGEQLSDERPKDDDTANVMAPPVDD